MAQCSCICVPLILSLPFCQIPGVGLVVDNLRHSSGTRFRIVSNQKGGLVFRTTNHLVEQMRRGPSLSTATATAWGRLRRARRQTGKSTLLNLAAFVMPSEQHAQHFKCLSMPSSSVCGGDEAPAFNNNTVGGGGYIHVLVKNPRGFLFLGSPYGISKWWHATAS